MIDLGQWDHEDHYDATYANCNAWGEQRWSTPGVLIDGKLVTTRLTDINVGLEEFVEHSFYEKWDDYPFKTDPLGNPLSPNHPWNKTTIPRPGSQNWKERYSWVTTPTWDRRTFEAGAYARVYISALAGKLPKSDYVASTGKSLKLNIPGAVLPAMELEWKPPAKWNAFERNRARAYAVAFNLMVTVENLVRAFDLQKRGETKVATPFEIPSKGHFIGVGFWGAGRGFLSPSLRDQGRVACQLSNRHAVDDQCLSKDSLGRARPLRTGRPQYATGGEHACRRRQVPGNRYIARDPLVRSLHALHDARHGGRERSGDHARGDDLRLWYRMTCARWPNSSTIRVSR